MCLRFLDISPKEIDIPHAISVKNNCELHVFASESFENDIFLLYSGTLKLSIRI